MAVCPFSPIPSLATPSGLPLLVDLRELSRLLARSEASLLRDVEAGRVPAPVKVGRSTRWRRAEIESWIAAGCPASASSRAHPP
ncbi:MAG TPA: hypothetical protein VKE74_15805 [Gemmataceae bacterium]|nr:hypothetical protein [Gemmataceae bacterium]